MESTDDENNANNTVAGEERPLTTTTMAPNPHVRTEPPTKNNTTPCHSQNNTTSRRIIVPKPRVLSPPQQQQPPPQEPWNGKAFTMAHARRRRPSPPDAAPPATTNTLCPPKTSILVRLTCHMIVDHRLQLQKQRLRKCQHYHEQKVAYHEQKERYHQQQFKYHEECLHKARHEIQKRETRWNGRGGTTTLMHGEDRTRRGVPSSPPKARPTAHQNVIHQTLRNLTRGTHTLVPLGNRSKEERSPTTLHNQGYSTMKRPRNHSQGYAPQETIRTATQHHHHHHQQQSVGTRIVKPVALSTTGSLRTTTRRVDILADDQRATQERPSPPSRTASQEASRATVTIDAEQCIEPSSRQPPSSRHRENSNGHPSKPHPNHDITPQERIKKTGSQPTIANADSVAPQYHEKQTDDRRVVAARHTTVNHGASNNPVANRERIVENKKQQQYCEREVRNGNLSMALPRWRAMESNKPDPSMPPRYGKSTGSDMACPQEEREDDYDHEGTMDASADTRTNEAEHKAPTEDTVVTNDSLQEDEEDATFESREPTSKDETQGKWKWRSQDSAVQRPRDAQTPSPYTDVDDNPMNHETHQQEDEASHDSPRPNSLYAAVSQLSEEQDKEKDHLRASDPSFYDTSGNDSQVEEEEWSHDGDDGDTPSIQAESSWDEEDEDEYDYMQMRRFTAHSYHTEAIGTFQSPSTMNATNEAEAYSVDSIRDSNDWNTNGLDQDDQDATLDEEHIPDEKDEAMAICTTSQDDCRADAYSVDRIRDNNDWNTDGLDQDDHYATLEEGQVPEEKDETTAIDTTSQDDSKANAFFVHSIHDNNDRNTDGGLDQDDQDATLEEGQVPDEKDENIAKGTTSHEDSEVDAYSVDSICGNNDRGLGQDDHSATLEEGQIDETMAIDTTFQDVSEVKKDVTCNTAERQTTLTPMELMEKQTVMLANSVDVSRNDKKEDDKFNEDVNGLAVSVHVNDNETETTKAIHMGPGESETLRQKEQLDGETETTKVHFEDAEAVGGEDITQSCVSKESTDLFENKETSSYSKNDQADENKMAPKDLNHEVMDQGSTAESDTIEIDGTDRDENQPRDPSKADSDPSAIVLLTESSDNEDEGLSSSSLGFDPETKREQLLNTKESSEERRPMDKDIKGKKRISVPHLQSKESGITSDGTSVVQWDSSEKDDDAHPHTATIETRVSSDTRPRNLDETERAEGLGKDDRGKVSPEDTIQPNEQNHESQHPPTVTGDSELVHRTVDEKHIESCLSFLTPAADPVHITAAIDFDEPMGTDSKQNPFTVHAGGRARGVKHSERDSARNHGSDIAVCHPNKTKQTRGDSPKVPKQGRTVSPTPVVRAPSKPNTPSIEGVRQKHEKKSNGPGPSSSDAPTQDIDPHRTHASAHTQSREGPSPPKKRWQTQASSPSAKTKDFHERKNKSKDQSPTTEAQKPFRKPDSTKKNCLARLSQHEDPSNGKKRKSSFSSNPPADFMSDVTDRIPRKRRLGSDTGTLTSLLHSVADPLSNSSPTHATQQQQPRSILRTSSNTMNRHCRVRFQNIVHRSTNHFAKGTQQQASVAITSKASSKSCFGSQQHQQHNTLEPRTTATNSSPVEVEQRQDTSDRCNNTESTNTTRQPLTLNAILRKFGSSQQQNSRESRTTVSKPSPMELVEERQDTSERCNNTECTTTRQPRTTVTKPSPVKLIEERQDMSERCNNTESTNTTMQPRTTVTKPSPIEVEQRQDTSERCYNTESTNTTRQPLTLNAILRKFGSSQQQNSRESRTTVSKSSPMELVEERQDTSERCNNTESTTTRQPRTIITNANPVEEEQRQDSSERGNYTEFTTIRQPPILKAILRKIYQPRGTNDNSMKQDFSPTSGKTVNTANGCEQKCSRDKASPSSTPPRGPQQPQSQPGNTKSFPLSSSSPPRRRPQQSQSPPGNTKPPGATRRFSAPSGPTANTANGREQPCSGNKSFPLSSSSPPRRRPQQSQSPPGNTKPPGATRRFSAPSGPTANTANGREQPCSGNKSFPLSSSSSSPPRRVPQQSQRPPGYTKPPGAARRFSGPSGPIANTTNGREQPCFGNKSSPSASSSSSPPPPRRGPQQSQSPPGNTKPPGAKRQFSAPSGPTANTANGREQPCSGNKSSPSASSSSSSSSPPPPPRRRPQQSQSPPGNTKPPGAKRQFSAPSGPTANTANGREQPCSGNKSSPSASSSSPPPRRGPQQSQSPPGNAKLAGAKRQFSAPCGPTANTTNGCEQPCSGDKASPASLHRGPLQPQSQPGNDKLAGAKRRCFAPSRPTANTTNGREHPCSGNKASPSSSLRRVPPQPQSPPGNTKPPGATRGFFAPSGPMANTANDCEQQCSTDKSSPCRGPLQLQSPPANTTATTGARRRPSRWGLPLSAVSKISCPPPGSNE